MKQAKGEHHDIFYPSIREKRIITASSHEAISSQVFLLPHAAWEISSPVFAESKEAISTLNPPLIIILAPLHQPIIQEDRPAIAFLPEEDTLRLCDGTEIHFPSSLKKLLLDTHHETVKTCSSYFSEEPAPELTMAFLSEFLSVPVLPLLTGAKTSAECAHLSEVLTTIFQTEPHTLFLISSNMCAPEKLQQTEFMKTLLETGSNQLLSSRDSNLVSSCGTAIFEALRRAPWCGTRWNFFNTESGMHAGAYLQREELA